MLHARAAAVMTLLLCGFFAVLAVTILTENTFAGAAVMVLFAGAGVLWLLFGFTGAVSLGAVLSAFLLMARYDEGWALPLDHIIKIKVTYLITTACVIALVFAAATRSVFGVAEMKPEEGRAQRCLTYLLCGFALFALALNHATDDMVPVRQFKGEMLALLAIVIPMGFVWLLPRSPLSEFRALLSIRTLIVLGGLAGFIMGMFGLLPGAVLGALGWSVGNSGTLELVRGRLPLGHPNTVAAIMLLLLPPAIVLGFNDRSYLWRMINLGCALSMFGGTLFALSRAAFMAMLLAIAATMAYLFLTQKQRKLMVSTLLAGVVIVFVGIMAYLFTHMDFSRFWSRGFYEDSSVQRRYESLLAVLAVWRDHPFVGVSPDAVYPRFDLRPEWEPPAGDIASPIIYYRGMPSAETPHNMYLTAFAEFGTIGGFIFFGVIVATLLQLYRAQRQMDNLLTRRMVFGFIFGIGAFLLMGVFEALLMTSLRAATVFWVFCGLSLRFVALNAPSKSGHEEKLPPSAAAGS